MNFAELFTSIDIAIMQGLGDDITFYRPVGAPVETRCVLSARPGGGGPDVYTWLDNVWARIDILSLIIELPENAAPTIGKTWQALYAGQRYLVSEVIRKGDGTLAVVLNQSGNATAKASGWQ
jgi:hypothetical protein